MIDFAVHHNLYQTIEELLFSGKYEIKKETLYITRMLYTGQVETGEMAESFLIPDFSRFLKKRQSQNCFVI